MYAANFGALAQCNEPRANDSRNVTLPLDKTSYRECNIASVYNRKDDNIDEGGVSPIALQWSASVSSSRSSVA